MSLNTTDHYWSAIQDRWPARAHLKWLAKIYSGATPSRENAEYWAEGVHPWIGSGEVSQTRVTEPTALISDLAVQETSTKLMRKGALIIALAGQGRTKGTVAQLGIDCFGNQSLSCIDARNEDDRFLFWWLTSLYRQIRGLASDDSRDGLNQEMVGSIPIPKVDIGTQRIIADYLDRETTRIDALIAEKERMLALLEEKRAALISRVVTRGLDPSARLKSSGLEWLGEIPAHWEVRPIKYLAVVGNGSTPSIENADYWSDEGYPWLNSSVVNVSPVTNASRFVTGTALRECHLPKIQPPAVLVGITGQGKTRGMAAVLGIEATINQHIAFIKPHSEELQTQYLCLLLGHAYEYLRSDSDGAGSTKGAITCEQLANMKIPVPPSREQVEICARVSGWDEASGPLRAEIERSITLLAARRSALITSAVTGQIFLHEMPGTTEKT